MRHSGDRRMEDQPWELPTESRRPSTTIRGFAERNRLKTRRDGCGEAIIPGRLGHIYEHGPGGLGVMFMPDPKAQRPARPKLWTNAKKKLLTAGLTLQQDCDDEGSALFDTDNLQQVRATIRVIRTKRQRVPSHAQRTVLGRARAARRVVQTLAPGENQPSKLLPWGPVMPRQPPCPKRLKKLEAALE